MTPTEIKRLWYERFFSREGLGCLNPHDGAPKEAPPVDNDNGILFAAVMYALFDWLQILRGEDRDCFEGAMGSLEVEPGLYNRRPDQPSVPPMMEAQDDYVGIAAISKLFGTHHADDVVNYGERNFWCFNNLQPGKLELRACRQGMDTCFYKVCAGRKPLALEWLWLVGYLMWTAHRADPGEQQLVWLKWRAMRREDMPFYVRGAFNFWREKLVGNFGGIHGVFVKYYREDHPAVLLSALMTEEI